MATCTINHVDTCLSDYFQGSPHDVIAVPVDGDSTVLDVLNSITDDVRGSCFDWTAEQCDAFGRAILRLQEDNASVLDKRFDSSLEPRTDDDYGDSVYAYFVVRFETEGAE